MRSFRRIKKLFRQYGGTPYCFLRSLYGIFCDSKRIRTHDAESELFIVNLLCDADKASFDIGAHGGIYSYVMERHSKLVLSFEPIPELAKLIRYKYNVIARKNIIVNECAVSDMCGEVELIIPDHAEGTSTIDEENINNIITSNNDYRIIKVHRTMMDQYDNYTVGMVKIDVEGHEIKVIRGGLSLIKRDLPNMIIECEERYQSGSLHQVIDLLSPLGYECHFLHNNELLPIKAFNYTSMQSPTSMGHSDGNYINNFIFTARQGACSAIKNYLSGGRTGGKKSQHHEIGY